MGNIKKELFIGSIKAMQAEVHANARAHGWHTGDTGSDDDYCRDFLLLVSEISEATEALRVGNPESEHIPGFTAVEEELADEVIRVMELSERRGLRLAEAIVAKHEYNKTRPYRHGGKRF